MKKTFLSQILVITIIVALMGSFGVYAQDNSAGPIPKIYTDKFQGPNPLRDNVDTQFNLYDFLASQGFAYGAQTGVMQDIQLPSGVVGNMPPWAAATGWPSGMTRDPSLAPNSYWIVDTGDSVWQFDDGSGLVNYWGMFTVPVGANGIAYNPADGFFYLATGTDLWMLPTMGLPMTPTLVGPFNTGGLMIDLCFDFSGTCYAYDLGTDMAYTVNTITGNATALGSLGYDANFGQGMGYDYETGWIYLTAFDYGAFDGQLRVMDPATGYTNVLASFGLNQMDPFSAQTNPMLPLAGPGRATAPTPLNGEPAATGVPSITLSWTNPGGAVTNEVYFGLTPSTLALISSGSLATSVSVTVAYSTTYYWYVNEIDGGSNTTQGTLWSFTSEASPCPVAPLPVTADFEDGLFPPTCWTQNGVIWGNYNGISGYGSGAYSAVADFYGVSSGFDDLVSIEYNSTGAPTPMLTFDWAYATYPGAVDHLELYYSTDSGTSWVLLADMYDAAPGDDNLNPFNLSQTGPYFPLATEWSTRSINLPANTTNVSFTAVTDWGNLLWVDNIQITSELFFDDMEAYTAGGQLACQNPTDWTTWSGAPCGNEDALISTNYAFSGVNSALIDVATPRWVDLLKLLGTKTSGKWYINMAVYIPTGKAGYFNTMNTALVDWGMECYFNAGGAGLLDNGTVVNFTWVEDQWNQVMVVVDLNTSIAEFWFGPGVMTQLATWDWTRAGTLPNTLDAVDFYAATTSDEMYFDDFRFSDAAPPILQLADDVGTLSIDLATQVAPGTVVPLATVKNYGTATQTFNVEMTITGGYSDIQSVTTLAPGATQQVTFANWTAVTGGPNTVNVTTQLVGDGDPTNDALAQTLYVWDPSGTWTSGTSYPQNVYLGSGQGYSNGAVNKLYSIGGITASGLETECYEYDVPTDTWTPLASLPAGIDRHATALVGDFVYAMGGYDPPNVIQSNVYKYDIVGDSWTTVASLPTPIGWNKAVGYNTYIYHAGGYDGTNILADVYVYDTVTDTWATATPMPGVRFGGAFSIVGNQLIYVGGASDGPISDAVFVGTITAPGVISWVTADNPFPGAGNNSESGSYGNLSELLVREPSFIKGILAEAYPPGGMYRFDAAPWGSDKIIVAGGSPSGSWVAEDPNPCYVYEPASDTWTAQENVLKPVTAATSGSVYDGSTWKLIMTGGIDEAGVLGDTTQIYTQTLGGTTFALSVTVADGWNMVSVPGLHPTNQNVDTWWSGKDPAADVFKYAGGYTAVTTTTPTEGYWMKNVGAQVYNYAAIQVVPHTDVPLALGWNLIGLYENTVPTPPTTNPPGIITTTIYEYSGGYNPASNIVPGYGYWVKADLAGSIVGLSAPPLGKGSVEAAELFNKDWGRIIITDNAGISYTLYAVTGEVDLNRYELPPSPPAEMFDIRFGSDRIAEDINSSIQSILMSGLEYPVKVRVENMSITLQDESGTKINAELKPGEELAINNSSINKLLVLSGEIVGPIEYALEQNYPNPFNPATTIKFSVPEATNVTLTIYNTLGQKVTELVNGKLEAGRYSYQWDAGNVATGIYIYELRANKFVSVKKMILLK